MKFKAIALVGKSINLDDLEEKAARYNGVITDVLLTPEELQEVVAVLTQEFDIIFPPGGTVFDPQTFVPWLQERKPNVNLQRWEAYKALLTQRDWEQPVIRHMDTQSDDIVELMGDPLAPGSWARRGLLMGEVQSGKTANYIGVLSKAMDFGYKVIIVIGGHTKELRKQTQRRVDSDLLGIDSEYIDDNIVAGALRRIGIGEIDTSLRAHVMTTVKGDFSASKKSAGIMWIDSGLPTVFVIKKNATLIANVANYIKRQSESQQIDLPLVVIDDEADWGTPNTGSETDPTRVNREIRKLLDSSSKSTYVGITATPFANIFIDEAASDSQHGKDLFPSDYIRVVSSPSTYFGINQYFSEGHGGMRLEVQDCLDVIPILHKRDLRIHSLPQSLKTAVVTFLLGTAIRRLRDEAIKPASMLVNVSRFNDVQAQVAKHIQEYLDEIRSVVAGEFARDTGQYSIHYQLIHDTWAAEFKESDSYTWSDVKSQVLAIVTSFVVELVNSRTSAEREKLRKLQSDEERREIDLKPTIFVGGDVLSRGLTLEGLQVSYFVREPRTMDTLMQMGRWFGYRPGYSDLVRVWLPKDTAEDFAWSGDVTEELKELLIEMRSRSLTPRDFGLRVRTHPEGFKIVAANKSKSARVVTEGIVFDGLLLESNKLANTEEAQASNRSQLDAFVRTLRALEATGEIERFTSDAGYTSWHDVPLSEVQNFVASFTGPANCEFFGPGPGGKPSVAFEALSDAKGATYWDVSLVRGSGGDYPEGADPLTSLTIRNKLENDPQRHFVRFDNRRVAAPNSLTGSFSTNERLKVLAELGPTQTLNQKSALAQIERPRLLIFVVAAQERQSSMLLKETVNIATEANPAVALAIAFPKLSQEEALEKGRKGKKYTVNSVTLRNLYGVEDEGDDQEVGGGDDD